MNGPILLAGASCFNDSIFTLTYSLDDAVFTPVDGFGHLLAFFLPGFRLRLGAMSSFSKVIHSLVF